MDTVRLAYGETGLDLLVDPAVTTVVAPEHHRATEPSRRSCRRALRAPVAGPPLRDRVQPGQTVAISACDGTRPQPRQLMIPAILEELDGIVDLDDVVVLVATGTHRGNTEAELRAMFGDEVVDTVRIVNHDARDRDSLTWVGELRRRRAGLAQPRVGRGGRPDHDRFRRTALLRRVLRRPEARRARAGRAWRPCWCCTTPRGSATRARPGAIIEGNPVHDDVRAIAAATGVTSRSTSCSTGTRRSSRAFGGDLLAMHAAAMRTRPAVAMRPVPRRSTSW